MLCSAQFRSEERIILIEDTAEIQLCKPNLVRFEARRACGDLPEVSIRDLIKASLRHRPDRIIVGEVRGGEAFDLLQALNTGHAGSVSTIHANSAVHALTRLAHCVLQSGIGLPYASIRGQIGESLDLIVQIERRQGKRLVTEVIEVAGFDYARDGFALQSIYRRSSRFGRLQAPASRGRYRHDADRLRSQSRALPTLSAIPHRERNRERHAGDYSIQPTKVFGL